MVTVFKVALKSGKSLSPRDFPGMTISLAQLEAGLVQLSIAGDGTEAERILLTLKDSIYCYRRLEIRQRGARSNIADKIHLVSGGTVSQGSLSTFEEVPRPSARARRKIS